MTAELGATASSISLAHLLAVAGLDLSDALLIRHPLSHDRVRQALEADQLRQYTSSQGERFPGRQRFWLVFLGEALRGLLREHRSPRSRPVRLDRCRGAS